jgi:hypothetical protein
VEYAITWGGDPEDVCVTTSGTASVKGLHAWTEELVGDPRFRPDLRLLLDHRRLDWNQMRPEDIERLAELTAEIASDIGQVYVATVMGRPVDFGIARMEQQHLESHDELQGIELRVFSTIEDARDWLATLPAPASDSDAS